MTTPRYTATDLASFRENYAETEYLVHVAGPDLTMTADDEGKPFTLYEADRLAERINNAPAAITRQHATVFHYGVPVELDVHATFTPLKPGQGKSQGAAGIDPDVATLRAAAAQARVEAQDQSGPSRTVTLNYASMLMNEADKVEGGDRGTLPPVLASAQAWLREAVASA